MLKYNHDMNTAVDVVIGSPVYRRGAYVLDKFLSNQQLIQQQYPSCELVLSTNEADLFEELKQLPASYRLRGTAICYETIKPGHAGSPIWNITCGREAIRRYVLSQTAAKYYLSVDTDMVYDPAVVNIMKTEIQGHDVVFSGCPLRNHRIGLAGAGCMMINRKTLENVQFRCVEFRNGGTMSEDNMLEMDSFRRGSKIRKGIFLNASHYLSEDDVEHVEPQSLGAYRRITTTASLRYLLFKVSLLARCNIPSHLWRTGTLVNKYTGKIIRY